MWCLGLVSPVPDLWLPPGHLDWNRSHSFLVLCCHLPSWRVWWTCLFKPHETTPQPWHSSYSEIGYCPFISHIPRKHWDVCSSGWGYGVTLVPGVPIKSKSKFSHGRRGGNGWWPWEFNPVSQVPWIFIASLAYNTLFHQSVEYSYHVGSTGNQFYRWKIEILKCKWLCLRLHGYLEYRVKMSWLEDCLYSPSCYKLLDLGSRVWLRYEAEPRCQDSLIQVSWEGRWKMKTELNQWVCYWKHMPFQKGRIM